MSQNRLRAKKQFHYDKLLLSNENAAFSQISKTSTKQVLLVDNHVILQLQ